MATRVAPPPATRGAGGGHRLVRRLAEGYLAAVAFLAIELLLVAWLRRRELASSGEIVIALSGLLPVGALAALPVAGVGAALAHAIEQGGRRVPRIAAGLTVGAFGGLVAWSVSTGRHLAGERRPVFAAGVALAGALATWVLAPVAARALARLGPRRTPVVLGALVVLLVVVEVANALVLPRLYPGFHVGLSALAVGLAAATCVARTEPSRGFVAPLALAVFAGAAALTPSAASRSATADNVRVVFLEHAPVLARAVEVAALVEPPAPIEPEVAEVAAPTGGSLELDGWDILLVTVDALRADHVGAYGYARATTPALDRLAAEGAVFEAAYTATPHTSYAVASLMTGKFVRPLLLMGLGEDSETWAEHLRRYGFKTGAFYPPAVFFIDTERFGSFIERDLGFEYQRKEFLTAAERPAQLDAFLAGVPDGQRAFAWVHLFEPHEPYEKHTETSFGDRDVDRYDDEIAFTDRAIDELVRTARARRPKTLVIVTADHGEEFGEHGGRYHGTTVYEEQARVPLVIHAPGLVAPRRIAAPASLVDLLPTVLAGLDVPRPARIRGRDLGPWLLGQGSGPGAAFAETDAMAMVAEGPHRLVCQRRAGACTLFDLLADPGQTLDASSRLPAEAERLRATLRRLDASHGRYETSGLRAEGKALPEALRRGIGGDGDAAPDVAALLDDADVALRRRAAEVLFELRRPDVTAQLRLAVSRDEDPEVRAFASLALTRLGEGSPQTFELLFGPDVRFRRLAALALAERGDPRGEEELVRWWRAAHPPGGAPQPRDSMPYERALEVIEGLATIRARTAVAPMVETLGDVRLRPHLARALARIGEDVARPALAARLAEERYQSSRVALTEALLALGAGPEMRVPLVTMLGVPDPLPNAVAAAISADLLEHVGGPTRTAELTRLRRFANSGVAVDFLVPEGEAPPTGARVVCRATAPSGGRVIVGRRKDLPAGPERKAPVPARQPAVDPSRSATLEVPARDGPQEVFAPLPPTLGVRPGKAVTLVVYATQGVDLDACVVVPTRDEIPPPPPEPVPARPAP